MSAAVAALLSLLPADPPAPPTAADIAAMVRRLGADDSAVREKAQADLWAAGPAAEPAVRAATRGPDPEVARRAWLVRAKFDAGLFPDTPPDVAERIIGYRDGDAAARAATVAALADRGPAGAV
ncbi:MAG: hypothetical protein K2X87_02920, partial [Gemmataceae bacterium]|nr:hypothetical protein [Gemmataceae bacterium]